MTRFLRLLFLAVPIGMLLACSATPPARAPGRPPAAPVPAPAPEPLVPEPVTEPLPKAVPTKPPPPPLSNKLSPQERDALAALVLGPKPNPIKQCVVSALGFNAALVTLKRTRTPVEAVRKSLVSSAKGRTLALRESQYAAWKKGGTPGDLAGMNFNDCTDQAKLAVPADPVLRTCFNQAALPAAAEFEKAIKTVREGALVRLLKEFETKLPAHHIRKVTEDVFESDAESDGYAAHRRVFAQCIRQAG
jgi:hypothetical protein